MKPVAKSKDEWKALLSEQAYKILIEKDTEPAKTGEYDKHYPKSGHYACKGCGLPLYSFASKFDSGCGWPAYSSCYHSDAANFDLGAEKKAALAERGVKLGEADAKPIEGEKPAEDLANARQCHVNFIPDDSIPEYPRVEITCARCEGHLGHIFLGESGAPGGERHCVNSASVKYVDTETAEVAKEFPGLGNGNLKGAVEAWEAESKRKNAESKYAGIVNGAKK